MRNFIYVEFYNERWHLKGECSPETVEHAKKEFGPDWKEKLCGSNEKVVTEEELKGQFTALYAQLISVR